MVLSHAYYFHRWWFHYNDTGTSPTYTDTPFFWQAAKYPLFLGLTVVSLGALMRRRRPSRSSHALPTGGFAGALASLLVVLACITLAAAVKGSDAVTPRIRDWFFLPLVLSMPFFYRGDRTLRLLLGALGVVTLYHVAFSAVELVAYQRYGRLPGLAYRGSLVRFGGGLDDPNGFGLFLALPILLLLAGWPVRLGKPSRAALLGILLALEIATVSFSAFGALTLGLLVFLLIARQPAQGLAVLLAGLAAGTYAVVSGHAATTYGQKIASASTRFNLDVGSLDVGAFTKQANWRDWFLGAPSGRFVSETSYFQLLESYGVLVSLLVLALGVLTVCRGLARVRALFAGQGDAAAKIFAALTAFECAFLVGSLGVPYLSVFPLNMLFWVVAMVIWLPYGPDRETDRSRPWIPRRGSLLPEVASADPQHEA